jgi:hypothetical protein
MSVKTGTIRGREVTKNRDGSNDRLMLQVEMSSPDDIQTVEYVSLPGQDENPINGSKVYVIEVGSSYKIGIGVDDGITPDMDTGEKRLYSLDDAGAIQAFIKLLKSGIIHINGSADFAIRFNALDTALQAMLTALNADIVVAGGAGSTTLDISGAKVDEVKLP